MKSIYTTLGIAIAVLIIPTFFSFTKPLSSGAAPTGYTGALNNMGGNDANCTSCHSSFGLNSTSGNVSTVGLPNSITLGASYNFSTIITHDVADRERFGFAVKAVDANGVAVGTFSTTNTNAGVSTNEIGHRIAPSTIATNTYSFDNLIWTAPSTTPVYPITFFIVGNAANRNFGTSGDYIYSTTVVANASVLPVNLSKFSAKQLGNADVTIQWRTEQEVRVDKFEIEKSADGQVFSLLTTTKAQGNSNTSKDYTSIDKNPTTKGEFIYYRLKMFDNDGSFKYSDIVKVTLNANETIVKNVGTIHNALNNTFEVNILSPITQQLNINWLASNGQLVTTETKILVKGSNNFKLSNTKFAKGELLFLQFKTAGFNKSYTLVN